MTRIEDFNFKNKKVLLRVDYNVPLNEKRKITDATRIDKSLKTINKILDDGGAVIILSHLGRPDGRDESLSLKPIYRYLQEAVDVKVFFCEDCIGQKAKEMAKKLPFKKILLLENLRFHKEEMEGNEKFARKLATYGDVFVNDAFSTSHRAHASTSIIAKFFNKDEKMFGFQMQDEIENLDKVMKDAKHPFTAVLGGSKISTKIGIINNLLKKVDHIILGGGMNYTVHKALGGNIGGSLYEEDMLSVAKEILEKAKKKKVTVHISTDTTTGNDFKNDVKKRIYPTTNIPDDMEGMDIGPETAIDYRNVILNSKTILWNGPVGVFEFDNFSSGTFVVADSISRATENGTFSLVGGGDTIAAINKFGLTDTYNYASTAGGAMLEYCEGRKLPGIISILED